MSGKEGKVVGSSFNYKDPVDHSQSQNQGLVFRFEDSSRVIFRKSGTGSVGITLRIYFEKYDAHSLDSPVAQALKGIIDFGLQVSQITQLTGRQHPDVIT